MNDSDSPGRTILACFPHVDDEISCLGSLCNHLDAGDRAILVWATRGEMTSLFGDMSMEEIIEHRQKHADRLQSIIGCEIRFLGFPDAGIRADRDTSIALASMIAELKPDVLIGYNLHSGHPDHRYLAQALLDATTFARLPRMVAPLEPHRPKGIRHYGYFDAASTRPDVYVDISSQIEKVCDVARIYAEASDGWRDAPQRHRERRRRVGQECGVEYAERYNLLAGSVPVSASL